MSAGVRLPAYTVLPAVALAVAFLVGCAGQTPEQRQAGAQAVANGLRCAVTVAVVAGGANTDADKAIAAAHAVTTAQACDAAVTAGLSAVPAGAMAISGEKQ